MDKTKLDNADLEKISGGRHRQCVISCSWAIKDKSLKGFNCLDFHKEDFIWGKDLDNDVIPIPWEKNASINYGGKSYHPVICYVGWHQSEVIWADEEEKSFLVPTGIYQHSM